MFNTIEEQLNTVTLHFSYLDSHQVNELNLIEPGRFDVAVLFPSFDEQFSQLPFHYNPEVHEIQLDKFYKVLDRLDRVMTNTGTLYIYGLPQWLPYFSVYLDKHKWQFKYWLALEAAHSGAFAQPITSTHQGILLFVRNKDKFSLRKVRSPHQMCEVCGDFVADWGGKKHLRNLSGYAISDVWDDLPTVKDKEHILSKEVWQRLIFLTAKDHARILCLPYDGVQDLERYIFE